MKRPVTFATNNGDIAGGEVMLFAMASAARQLGCDVTVVGPAHPSDVIDRARSEGFRTVEVSAVTRRSYAAGLRAWDRRHREGLLWCNGLLPSFATAGHRDRVIHLHQRPRSRMQHVCYRLALAGAARCYVPSASMQRVLPGTRPLENWVEPVVCAPHRRSSGETVLGFMGRLSSDKGVPALAEALRIVQRRSDAPFRLVLAGDHRSVDPHDQVAVRTALRGLEQVVDEVGWMSRQDFFSSIDVAVFPSVWAEPFGLVVAEAMSARVPFVISDAGALPEVAGEGYPWVARRGDAHDLARVIEQASAADNTALVEQQYERWQQHFSPEAGRDRLARALRELGVLKESA